MAMSLHEQLARELFLAHAIIRNAFSVMSTEQRCQWGKLNIQEGVDGRGVTRADERTLLLSKLITPDRFEQVRTQSLSFKGV